MSLSRTTAAAIESIGGDPTDLLWEWIAAYGPHGHHFTWGQTKREPPGYVGVEHLEKAIDERDVSSLGHREELRKRVSRGLGAADEGLLRRCIQIASIVGSREELDVLVVLGTHADGTVAADARAAAFHLKSRLKGG